jgi:hypothetical protein
METQMATNDNELLEALKALTEAVGRSGWHHAAPLISERQKRADLLNRAHAAIKNAK